MFDPDRRHLIAYLAAAAVLVVIAVRWAGRDAGRAPVPSISMAAPARANPARVRPRAPATPQPLIWIDVAGEVRRPGLYSLPKGARVAAAIERAGGVTRRANGAAVNLAARLTDGEQIFVPKRGPSGESPGSAGGGATAAGSSAAGSALGSAGGAGPGATAASATAGAGTGVRISLSTASESELEQLDGIGPSLAQRIIAYREQHGGFKSIEELQEVSGIGPKRFEALKGSIAP